MEDPILSLVDSAGPGARRALGQYFDEQDGMGCGGIQADHQKSKHHQTQEDCMARLEEVADRLELRALVDTYAFAADQRDRERFAGVFTADGTLATGQGGRRYVGREAIANVLNWVDERFDKTMHFVGNQIAEVHGDIAQGLVYCLAHHISNDDGQQRDTVMFVRYVDRYVRTANGWRIEERDLNIEWQEAQPLQIS